MKTYLAWAVVAGGLAACQTPTAINREDDFVVPITRTDGLGRAEQGLTYGDGPNGQQILYINFDGGPLLVVDQNQSPSDAPLNKTWIPNKVAAGTTITYPAFDTSPYTAGGTYTVASAKAKIVDTATSLYAGYNVSVVTTRPSSGRYTMMMVGGATSDWVSGKSSSTVGLAPLDCGNSNPNDIGFAFAVSTNTIRPATNAAQRTSNLLIIGQTVAHEAGHSFGLEHVSNTFDTMNPLDDGTTQTFVNSDTPLSVTPATCGGSNTQNDAQRLLTGLGSAPSGPALPKPKIAWLGPTDGQTLPPLSTLRVAAQPTTTASTITKVEIWAGGQLAYTYTTRPFGQDFNFQLGGYHYTALAYDSGGGIASADVSFTIANGATQQGDLGCLSPLDCDGTQACTNGVCVEPSCTPSCAPGQTCNSDGTCTPPLDGNPDMASSSIGHSPDMSQPPASSVIGLACDADAADCGEDGVCVLASSGAYCSVHCDANAVNSCPDGYWCGSSGDDSYCVLGSPSTGCDVAADARGLPPAGLAILLFAMIGFALRRHCI